VTLTARLSAEDEALDLLASRPLVVLTGAGLSTDSGIPDYRGPGAPTRAPMTYQEFVATPDAQQRYWARSHLGWQRMGRAETNAGHQALAALDPELLITQNVDGLHELAGSRDVVRFHGSIWQLRCALACGVTEEGGEDLRTPLPELPPRCPGCGGYARPGVVWFGEAIDSRILQRSVAATDCDVYLSIGTSSLVQPAAGLMSRAKARGAWTVEINPEPTDSAGAVDVAVALPAEVALPALRLDGAWRPAPREA
jgi:NAD-dependent SIR2 family protein deacetylase